MDVIRALRENEKLADIMDTICDINILPEFVTPEDWDGHLSFNIQGKTFGKDGSGGEYILLDDGSVGFNGSEGENGRIADNLDDFFLFIANCPFWRDYIRKEYYKDAKKISEFAKQLFDEHVEMAQEDIEIDLREAQKELSEGLNIPIHDDVSDILLNFYQSANREPRFISAFKEDDGSITYGSGSLFEA